MSESNNYKELQIRDWLKVVEFGEQALKFNDDVDKVIKELDLYRMSGGRTSVSSVKRLSHFDDLRFFSLGPIYTSAMVPFDIFGEFRGAMEDAKNRYEGPRVVLSFDTPVFEGLNEWDRTIEGIQSGKPYEDFVRYMVSQKIRQKEDNRYWAVEYVEVVIADPMAIDRRDYDINRSEDKALLGLFLPSGNGYRLKVAPVGDYPPLGFLRTSPDPTVVREATAMLST